MSRRIAALVVMDYRFGATKSKDDAPEFSGRETRYVHRVYAAIVINLVR